MTSTCFTRAGRVILALSLATLAAPTLAQEPPAGEPAQPQASRADLGPANDLVRSGAYAEAERVLAELQATHPDDPRILLMRGELLLALDRPDEAVSLLRRCIELDPVRERAHFQLGSALRATGDAQGALAAYGSELALTEDARVKVMAHLNRSVILQGLQDPAAAAAELRAALELDPTRMEAYGDLFHILLEAGRLDEAAEVLERGLAAGFRSAPHFHALGARHFGAGAHEKAAAAFRQALEINPDLAETVRSLATTLDKLGREAEALQQLRRYLELRPDDPDAPRIAARIRASGPR
jgi:tetratricopeptide (TPR) repeat protein